MEMGKPSHSMNIVIPHVNDSEIGSQGHQMEVTFYYSKYNNLI